MNSLKECPVCQGYKVIKYKANHYYGHKEVETKCWACRGTGYVNYNDGDEITGSVINEMYEALGV